MKKFIFYFSLGLSLLLLLNIVQILFFDLQNLTRFGFGYLAGKIILVMMFGILMYFTRDKKMGTKGAA